MNKFNLMGAFIAVFEEGSYTAAAKRLSKTKAMVSIQVNQLEEFLQIRLITRSTRSIKPTPAGVSYYEQAKQILDEISNIESGLRAEQQSLVGKLRLTAPTTFCELTMMPFIAELRKKHPELEIDIMLSDRYVDIINEGFDAAIRIGNLDDSSLIASHVGYVWMHLYASPDFIDIHGSPETLEELKNFPCVYDTNSRQPSNWEFITNMGRITVSPKQVVRVNSAVAAANMTKSGSVISYGPDFAVKKHFEKGQLLPLLSDAHQTKYPIHIVYPHRKHLSARVTTFIAELKKYLNQPM